MIRPDFSLTLAVLGGAGLLAGCSHTNPGAGADITYYLPRTNVSANLTLTLVECSQDHVSVEGDAAILAKAGAQGVPRQVSAASLASARVQRDLTISTGDDLVINGVNAQATDQTATIISNLTKLAVTVGVGGAAPMGLEGKPLAPLLTCTPTAQAALKRVKRLDDRIATLRSELATDVASGDVHSVRELNARIKERSDLKTKLLSVTVNAPIPLPNAPDAAASWNGDLVFRPEAFENWFGRDVSAETINASFPMVWTAARRPQAVVAATVAAAPSGRRLRQCGKSLEVPAPAEVEFQIKGKGGEGRAAGWQALEASEVFPIAQINAPAALCIDVGFAEQRTIEVAFDKFGRTTMLHWASTATAANVSGAVVGAAPDVKTLLAKTPSPSDIDQQRAEIERLKTLQEYNALKACEAVIAAGGSDCDADGQ